jgi:hypothetical protein
MGRNGKEVGRVGRKGVNSSESEKGGKWEGKSGRRAVIY